MQVVSREAIYYGVADCSFKASLLNWALPYAQRYLSAVHPDKYSQLKQSGFNIVNCLQVVVVEQLFYRNVIKSCGSTSEKRVKSTCLLEVCHIILCFMCGSMSIAYGKTSNSSPGRR